MFSKDIDISKKCPLGGRNTCQDNPQIGATKDLVKNATGYGYCAHEKISTWIKELKYGGYELEIEDEIGSNKPFFPLYYMLEVVTIYYREDKRAQNIKVPLLLGVKTHKGGNYDWYENLGGGNTIWKPIKDASGFPTIDPGKGGIEFKNKLDKLACELQNIVDLDLSKTDGAYCHNGHEPGNNNKIKVLLNPDVFDFPNYVVIEQTPNMEGGQLTIGGFNIGGTQQTVNGLGFPITRVTKITVFLPACDFNNPFLFHITSGDGSNGKWLHRTNDSSWKEVTSDKKFQGKGFKKANEEVRKTFPELTSGLSMTLCSAPRGEVKLDITKIPSSNEDETIYFDGNTPIHVKKVVGNGIKNGFFKLVHSTARTPFQLGTYLLNGQEIKKTLRPKEPIPNVKEVSVFYWNGDDKVPILLGITKDDGSSQQKYYSHRTSGSGRVEKGTWSQGGGYSSLTYENLTFMLDEQNCYKNHAVPFDIKEPTDPSQLYTNGKASTCLKTIRRITPTPQFPPLTIPGGDYAVKEYTVGGGGTQISRVTFGGEDTNEITLPKGYEVSKIRMFSYPGSGTDIPLMIEFKSPNNGVSIWYYSRDSSSTSWAKLGNRSNAFYSGPDRPTEALATGLDNVRCLRNGEVTMDLTKYPNKTKYKYCCIYHEGTGEEKVTVQELKVKVGYPKIPYYQHSLTNGGSHIASIKYTNSNGQRRKVNLLSQGFPISTNIVYVFHCDEKNPVLIYVDSTVHNVKGWYKQSDFGSDDSQWTQVISELSGIHPDNIKDCESWKKLYTELTNLQCKIYGECNDTPQPLSPGLGAGLSDIDVADIGAGSENTDPAPKETESTAHGSVKPVSVTAEAKVVPGRTQASCSRSGRYSGLFTSLFCDLVPSVQYNKGNHLGGVTGHNNSGDPKKDTAVSSNLASTPDGAEAKKAPQETAEPHYSEAAGSQGPEPSPESSEKSSTAPEGEAQKLGVEVAATGSALAGYISSGVFTGAGGLTGLGWWMFKRSKGDPWVRQI